MEIRTCSPRGFLVYLRAMNIDQVEMQRWNSPLTQVWEEQTLLTALGLWDLAASTGHDGRMLLFLLLCASVQTFASWFIPGNCPRLALLRIQEEGVFPSCTLVVFAKPPISCPGCEGNKENLSVLPRKNVLSSEQVCAVPGVTGEHRELAVRLSGVGLCSQRKGRENPECLGWGQRSCDCSLDPALGLLSGLRLSSNSLCNQHREIRAASG